MSNSVATRVLLYDVETSPNISYTWGKYDQNVLGFIKERQIICFAWKWLDEKEIHWLGLPSFPGYYKNQESNSDLIKALHKLISRADIVVGHNISGFDDRMVNTDFIVHGLNPPPEHKVIDTLKVARSRFRFNSNKLDDLGIRLGVGRKVKIGGFQLWVRCMTGDRRAWSEMEYYNKGDVSLLERVYLKERPWIKNHPDMGAKDNHQGCKVCRSINLINYGFNANRRGIFRRFQCKDCGACSSSKKPYRGHN